MGATFLAYCLSVAQKSVVLSAWISNSCSSINLMSWKELRLAACVYILRECVVNELAKEAGMEEASNFHQSFIS